MMTVNGQKISFSPRYLILLIIFALAVYVIVPQLGNFKASWHLLKSPDAGWTALAAVLTALTYFSAAATYVFLAFKPLKYLETVLVELAVMFINRLLPGGVGALGGNYLYLTKKKHTPAQAGVMVAINNALGFIGHNVLLIAVLLASGGAAVATSKDSGLSWLRYVVLGLVIIIVAALLVGRRRFIDILVELRNQLLTYRFRKGRLLLAFASSLSLTAANLLALYACAHALGIGLSVASIFIIFSLGLGAGTLAPTPGGLGGFEAGLVTGFIAYGVEASPALAAALLYRLISYWIPLLVGAICFAITQKRQLL